MYSLFFYLGNGQAPLQSTALIYPPIIPRPGTDLPQPMLEHSLININSSFSFLIGGETENDLYSFLTYFYNHLTNEWSNGPNLLQGRQGHAAGTVIDHGTHQQHVVVVGGVGEFDQFDSVELLYYGKNEWSQGIQGSPFKCVG